MERCVALWAGLACLVAACCAPLAAADRWANPPLTPTCDKQMDGILDQFYGENSTLAGCDDDCRKQCNEVLHFTFTIMDKQRCFTEDRIRECLVFASDAWTDFVRDCQTFQGHEIAGVTGRRRRLTAEAEGEGTAAAQPPSTAGRRRLAHATAGEGAAAAQAPSTAGRRRRRLAAEAEGEGTAAAQPPSAAGRRRRRLAAAEGGEGEAGEGATASAPGASDRVGCFPPFTKWQDFEVWLAITNKGAVAKNAALTDAVHEEIERVEKNTHKLPKPIRTHHWMAAHPQPACDDRLDALRSSYYGPNATAAPEDGGACDAGCRASCLTLLDDTWSARLFGRTCPARDVLLRCLLVAKDDWVDFVKDCETFQINFTPEGAAEGHAEGHAEGQASRGEGAAPAAGPAAGFARAAARGEGAEGAAPSPGIQTRRAPAAGEGEGAAAAPTPGIQTRRTPAAGEGARSHSSGEGEGSKHHAPAKAAPAPAEGAARAPTASRRLLAQGVTTRALDRVLGGHRRRRLAAEAEGAPPPPPPASKGEGEGGQAAAPVGENDGCFPDFQTWADFEAWLDGKLVEVGPDHGRASPVGLTSAFVFAGLIGSMAFF